MGLKQSGRSRRPGNEAIFALHEWLSIIQTLHKYCYDETVLQILPELSLLLLGEVSATAVRESQQVCRY